MAGGVDLSSLSDAQLLALKAAGGDLSKVPDDVLLALKHGAGPEAKGRAAVAGPNDAVNAFGNAVGRGGTLGYADELGAGVRALLPGFSNMAMAAPVLKRDESIGGGNEPAPQTVSTAPTIGERYDEELARLRTQAAADEKAHPYATTGGKVLGNVAVGGAVLPGMTAGASLLGNAVKFGAAGGALGAAQGFGEGEGGLANRATQAGVGAGLGAAGGAAVPVVGAVVNQGIQTLGVPVLRKAASIFDNVAPKASGALEGSADTIEQNAALHNIGRYMLTQKSTPESLQAGREALGPNAVLADLGPSMTGGANAARLESPEIKNLAQTLMEGRAKQYSPMLTEAAGAKEVPSLYEAGKMFGTSDKDVGAYAGKVVGPDLYGKMRAAGLNTSPEMQALIDKAPDIRDALAQIEKDYAGAGKVPTPIDLMDKVKQKLNKTATAKFNSGIAVDKNLVGDTANEFEKAFWAANPAAETASHGYANANSLRDFVDTGRRFMNEGTSPGQVEVSSQAVKDKLAEALMHGNQYAPGAYKLGVQNAIRQAAEDNPVNIATKRFTPEKEGIVSKLTQALGPEGSDKVLNAANAVRTFAKTSNTLTGGSSTVPNFADLAMVSGARINATKEGFFPRMTEKAADILGHIEKPNEAVLKRIGELLLNSRDAKGTIEALKAMHTAHAGTSAAKAAAGSSIFNTAASP